MIIIAVNIDDWKAHISKEYLKFLLEHYMRDGLAPVRLLSFLVLAC
jgi:hypothetical protein